MSDSGMMRMLWAGLAAVGAGAVASGRGKNASIVAGMVAGATTYAIYPTTKRRRIVKAPPEVDEPMPDASATDEPEGPLFAIEIHPPGASIKGLPPITNMDGFVVSDDCQVVAVGPMWWDAVGERIEELVGSATPQASIASTIVAEFFPEGLDLHDCAGARDLNNRLLERIEGYIQATA